MKVLQGHYLAAAQEAMGLPVVIDVLRAFTTSAVMYSMGLKELILVATVEEAFALREQHGWLLAGEIKGVKVTGFDFGNSPAELLGGNFRQLEGKTAVLRTSAGTQGVVAALNRCPQVILGSYVMAKAIAAYLLSLQPEIVTLIAMGQEGQHPAPEDVACSHYLAYLLRGGSYDHLHTVLDCLNTPFIQSCLKGEILHVPPEDVFLCLQPSVFNFVLVAERVDGLVRVSKHNIVIEPP